MNPKQYHAYAMRMVAQVRVKISRHLALMREAGVVEARREGTWMHYRINPGLPAWSKETIRHVVGQIAGLRPYEDDLKQLNRMKNRPGRICA